MSARTNSDTWPKNTRSRLSRLYCPSSSILKRAEGGGELRRYVYLNTRISILAGRLIPPERLDTLAAEAPLDAVFPARSPVQRTSAKGTLEDFLKDTRTPSDVVEQALLLRLVQDFLIITRPLSGAEREFVVHGLHWFELSNLKAIIRGKLAGVAEGHIREQLVDLGPFATLPVDELLRTEDAAELLRHLETTPYAAIARHARQAFEARQDLFAVDAAVDRLYFGELYERAQAVAKAERQAVLALAGFLVDQVNLIWLLRYRFSYGLSPAESYYLLISSVDQPATDSLRLTTDRIRALVSLSSLEDVLKTLPAEMQQWLEGATSISEVEDRLDRQGRRTSASALWDTQNAIARAFAYLLLRGAEMRQVLAIYKGKRLRLDPALIRLAARTGPS